MEGRNRSLLFYKKLKKKNKVKKLFIIIPETKQNKTKQNRKKMNNTNQNSITLSSYRELSNAIYTSTLNSTLSSPSGEVVSTLPSPSEEVSTPSDSEIGTLLSEEQKKTENDNVNIEPNKKIDKNNKNSISTASSEFNPIDFLSENREIGGIILGYLTVEYEPEKPKNFYSSGLFQKKELKEKIIKDFHNCQLMLTIKRILQKTVLSIKNEKKYVRKIQRIFRRTKYKKRKREFYENAKTKIESKLLVENNKKVSDYVLLDDLGYCLLLLDKILEIYDIKSSTITKINNELDDFYSDITSIDSQGRGDYLSGIYSIDRHWRYDSDWY